MLLHAHAKRLFRLLPVELGDEFVSNFDQINQKGSQESSSEEGNDDEFESKRDESGGIDFDAIQPDRKDTAFAQANGVVYFVSEDGNTQGQVTGDNYIVAESSETSIDLAADDVSRRAKTYKRKKRPDFFKSQSDFGSSAEFRRFKIPKEHVKYAKSVPIKTTLRSVSDLSDYF